MIQKSKYCILILCLYFFSCQDEELVSPILSDYTADFDSVWFKYDQKYPLFEYKNIDWHYSYQNYRDRFISISIEERNHLFGELLGVFKDPHIQITSASKTIIYSYVNQTSVLNINRDFINNYLDSINFRHMNNFWGWSIINNVGYLKISSLSLSALDTLSFGSIMDSLAATDGLILDIREEYGGNLHTCKYIVNLFTPNQQIVGYQQYRDGPSHDDYAPLIPVFVNPNNRSPYLKKVIVLIGGYCGSAGEILAYSLSCFSHVTLIGDTTMGSVEAPSTFDLSDGTKYTVPIIAYLDVNYDPLEWRGVQPDIFIDPELVSTNTHKDVVIEKAFEIIYSNTHITGKSTPTPR